MAIDDERRENTGRALVPDKNGRSLSNYTEREGVLRAYGVEDDDDISLRRYIDVLLRRKKIILTFFFIVLTTTIIGTFLSTPIYKATTKLEISLENPKILNFDQVLELDNDSREFYETQYLLLKSTSLIQQVIDELKLSEHSEFSAKDDNKNPVSLVIDNMRSAVSNLKKSLYAIIFKDKIGDNDENYLYALSQRNKLVEQILERIEVSPIGESRLVNISFEAKDRVLAAEVANGLADGYINWLLDRKIDATKQGRDFLKKQLTQTQINLENSEQALNDYAKQNDIVSLDQDMNNIYHTFSTLNDAFAQAQKERLEKESLYEHVKNGNIESLPQVINDEYIQSLKQEYAIIKSDYMKMSATFKSEYPALKELGAKVAEMQGKITEAEISVASSIESSYKASLKKEQALQERFKSQEEMALELNEKSVQYNILKREVDSNDDIYNSLLQRLKETEISSAVTTSNIQVVDYASVPLLPFKPRVMLNLLFACILGLGGGVLIAFFMEHLDNTVRSSEEVREKLRMPVLGGIYELKKAEKEKLPVEKSFIMDPKSHIAEAFRTIRTSLMLSTAGKPPRTILVTSCFPAEGKTTVSSNLASSFAQAGNSVILVEADLRRPRLASIMNSNGTGLSNYLTGNSGLEEVIKDGDIPNLSVITAGQLPINPAELLGSVHMQELIDKLTDQYDYVIIDGPPALGFVDAHLVSNIVDGVALVIRANSTPRNSIRELVNKLWSLRANFLGVIVNGIELNEGSYYYRSYNYYYGESEEDIKSIQAGKDDTQDNSHNNPFHST